MKKFSRELQKQIQHYRRKKINIYKLFIQLNEQKEKGMQKSEESL